MLVKIVQDAGHALSTSVCAEWDQIRQVPVESLGFDVSSLVRMHALWVDEPSASLVLQHCRICLHPCFMQIKSVSSGEDSVLRSLLRVILYVRNKGTSSFKRSEITVLLGANKVSKYWGNIFCQVLCVPDLGKQRSMNVSMKTGCMSASERIQVTQKGSSSFHISVVERVCKKLNIIKPPSVGKALSLLKRISRKRGFD